MAEQMRPASKQDAPDPSNAYERSHPENEAGMGRMDNNRAVPADSADKGDQAVTNKQDPTRQLNAQDVVNPQGANPQTGPAKNQPDHSMHEEEPDGWDMAPTDIHDKRHQRHPRKEGKGGTP